MPTDTRTQLRDLGNDLRRDSTPITMDEIIGSDNPAAPANLTRVRTTRRGARRATFARAAAFVATAAAVVGLVVIADRPDADPVADQPGSTVLPEAGAPAGALVLDTDVPGWELLAATVDQPRTDAELFPRRIYAIDGPRPEDGPSLVVESFDVDARTPEVTSSTATVSVGDVDGFLFDRAAGGRGLVYETDGFWYDLTAYNLTDTQLLAAGEAARRSDDGNGAIIDPSGLADQLTTEAVGVAGESWFLSLTAIDNPMSGARWEDGARSMWLQSFKQDPSIDRFQRIGAATVVDTTVSGQPAFIRTIEGQDDFRSITWRTDGHTHSLGSLGVSEQDLVQFAETLRPATTVEWDAVVDATAPPIACLGVECAGLPEPGSIVPAGVETFPTIDETLIPDDGGGVTFAQYSYFGGTESRGTTWIGVLGVADAPILDGLVTVMVSAASDAEPLPTQPGRSSDIAEYDYGTGVELVRTFPNNTVVVVQGRDVDQLYRVLDNIEPTTIDGDLSGYELIGELPDGLEELGGPFQRGLDNGSFPKLLIHGYFDITILPGPPLPVISGWLGPVEQLSVGGRPALFHSEPQNGFALLAVSLADGNTMTLTGDGFSQQEMIDLANSVEFLDEQTWKDRYDPILPILPSIVDAPATTETVDEGE